MAKQDLCKTQSLAIELPDCRLAGKQLRGSCGLEGKADKIIRLHTHASHLSLSPHSWVWIPQSCPPKWVQPAVRASPLWLLVGCLSLWPGDQVFFNLSFILRPRPSESSFDVGPALGGNHWVSEALSGLCPQPLAQARTGGLLTIRDRP